MINYSLVIISVIYLHSEKKNNFSIITRYFILKCLALIRILCKFTFLNLLVFFKSYIWSFHFSLFNTFFYY